MCNLRWFYRGPPIKCKYIVKTHRKTITNSWRGWKDWSLVGRAHCWESDPSSQLPQRCTLCSTSSCCISTIALLLILYLYFWYITYSYCIFYRCYITYCFLLSLTPFFYPLPCHQLHLDVCSIHPSPSLWPKGTAQNKMNWHKATLHGCISLSNPGQFSWAKFKQFATNLWNVSVGGLRAQEGYFSIHYNLFWKEKRLKKLH